MNEIDQAKINQLLSNLATYAKQGLITKQQVLTIFEPAVSQVSQPKESRISLQKILYYVGGFILLLGIVFFIYQFWNDMDQFSKILLTIVSAVSTYSLGYYFFHKLNVKDFGHAFFIISSALFPLAIGTTMDGAGITAANAGGISLNLAILFIIYFVSYYAMRAKIFLPFAIIAASSLFFSLTDLLFQNSTPIENFEQFRFLVLGFSYASIGYYFSNRYEKFLSGILYFFGLSFILGSILSLQGYFPNVAFLWHLIFVLILILSFYGSIKLQSKSFLVVSTIFTIGYILKLTAEFFSQSVGWPVSLIIAGLVVMVTGYFSFELNKRYLKKQVKPRLNTIRNID